MIQAKEIGYAGHFLDVRRIDVHTMPHVEALEPGQEPINTISFVEKNDQNEGELYKYILKVLGRCH